MSVVVGVDVGGPRKGFHAVALGGGDGGAIIATLRSTDAEAVAAWCRERGALVVAVDAPCAWRVAGGAARAAERQMAAEKISCYLTPTEAKARSHAFYTWMLAGAALYRALVPSHPLLDAAGVTPRAPCCVETFPQAVACALAGTVVSAKEKKTVRPALLRRAGIDAGALRGIDEVDATLCALTARAVALGNFRAYGDAAGGFIAVPASVSASRAPR